MTTSAAPRVSTIIRPHDTKAVANHPSEPGTGVTVTEVLGPANGATHISVAIVDIAPGGTIAGHLHPFEESFFVLQGKPLLNLGGTAYQLAERDFGLVPFAHGHAWANRDDEPARLLRLYAPQPRPMNGQAPWGVYAAPDVEPPTSGRAVVELSPLDPYVGHYDEADMAPPGSISMPGYHGANIKNVQIRMMVDDLLGSRQHTMFMVQFTPSDAIPVTAKEHFHTFEELYYLVAGKAMASFDGVTTAVAAGDLIFAPTGASHGFTPIGDEPVCWIEAQSPLPPASNGFTFHNDWVDLTPLG